MWVEQSGAVSFVDEEEAVIPDGRLLIRWRRKRHLSTEITANSSNVHLFTIRWIPVTMTINTSSSESEWFLPSLTNLNADVNLILCTTRQALT